MRRSCGPRRAAIPVLVALGALCCTDPRGPTADPPVEQPAQVDARADEVHRGQLVLGHEARSFAPCDDGAEAWVVDRTPGGLLTEAYRQLAATPYQPVFVEVRGEYGPPPAEGFGAVHTRQLTVHELRRAALEGPGCAEDSSVFEFRALGNEPFWNATVAESAITLSRADGPSPIVFPYASPEIGPDGTSYVSVTELPHFEIRIELTREPCTDTMSGARFSHAAHVLVDGREMKGCAYEGLPSRGPLDYSIRTVEKKSTGCGVDGTETCTWFRFDYPEIRSGLTPAARDAVAAAIESWIRAPLGDGTEPASPMELIERWEADYRGFRERFPDSAQGRRLERTVSVLAASPAFLSLQMREFADLGGAHPNEAVVLASFDARSGERIDLDDLLRPGARDELTRQAEMEFRRSKGLAPEADLAEAGYWFEGGRFALTENFALTATGVRFHFDAYEIAPYSMGSTTLVLSQVVIAPLLREKKKGASDHEAPSESLGD